MTIDNTTLGLAFGVALGFAGALGGLGVFLLVLLLGSLAAAAEPLLPTETLPSWGVWVAAVASVVVGLAGLRWPATQASPPRRRPVDRAHGRPGHRPDDRALPRARERGPRQPDRPPRATRNLSAVHR